jgi:transcriptional regulator with XRE-family HTH domain
MRSKPPMHSKNLESYRRMERTRRRWQKLRVLFKLGIEDAAFFVGGNKSRTPASLERRARAYFAMLLSYAKLERTNDPLRAHRLRQGLGLGEAAFLLAGIEDAGPLPNRLRAARLRTGLSRGDAARLIGKSRSVMSSYERGEREPGLETAMSLSTLYDLPIEELFPQRVGALNRRLRERKRMLATWRRTRAVPSHDLRL